MWNRLSAPSTVDKVKLEPEVKLKGILRNNTKNPTPQTIVSHRRSPKHRVPEYFDMEEWDEVFTAKDLTKIPVAKTNCIPIIPKKYRQQFENGTYTPHLRKNRGSSGGDQIKKNMTLDDNRKYFGAIESVSDLLKDTSSTEVRGITKRTSIINKTKISEKSPKPNSLNPDSMHHSYRIEEKPIKDLKAQRMTMEERKSVYNPSFLPLQNKSKWGQKSNDGKRLPIQSLVDKLIKDPVKFQLPERKNRINLKK